MQLGGIIGKLESNADKLGMILGGYQLLNSYGGGDPVRAGTDIVKALMAKPHFPNLGAVVNSLTSPAAEGQFFIPAVQAAVAGWVLNEVNVHPTLTRVGKVLLKGGLGAAGGIAAVTLVTYMGSASSPNPFHANMGAGPGGGSPSGENPFNRSG